MSEVKEISTLEEYKALVASNDAFVIDFTASWCPPCQAIKPKFAELAAATAGVGFYKLDVDENSDAAGEAGITAMPTFQFYKGGQRVDTLQGANYNALVEKVNGLK